MNSACFGNDVSSRKFSTVSCSTYAFDSKFKFTVDLTALHRNRHREVTSLPLLIMRAYVLERPLTNNAGLRFGTAAHSAMGYELWRFAGVS